MTATSFPSRRFDLPAVLRRSPVPAEGWSSLFFVVVMSLTVAWSVDDAGWVLGRGRLTDFLAPMAIAGALVGFGTAKMGITRWTAHLITALAAAVVLPLVVGSILSDTGGSPADLFRETAASAAAAWYDLAILNVSFTTQIGHHLLAFGIAAWGTGHFAAYAVFGHHRPLDAFVVLGIVLLGNMALTINDQLWYLVIFSVCGLLLLSRHHATEEASVWLRRRIGDPTAVRSLYQTGGSIFVVCAVVGALALTATASSAPLQGAWRGFESWLIEVSQAVQRFLPTGGATKPIGIVFGEQAQITGAWSPNEGIALQVQMAQDEQEQFYWRAAVYDRYSARGWSMGNPVETPRGADENVLVEAADDPAELVGRRDVSFTVTPMNQLGTYVVSPESPLRVDRPSEVLLVGEAGRFGALDIGNDRSPYTATARVPIIGDREDPNGLTEFGLIAAGEDYPADIVARYLDTGVEIGPEAGKILDEVLELSPSLDPFDVADTMEAYLRSSRFEYHINVQDELAGRCADLDIVECFAVTKKGYCQYYASTMAVLLREAGIPTRLAQGYLPGDRDRFSGIETVFNSASHAWVEVYFPGYGWVQFDPTGGALPNQEAPLPSGRPRSPAPSAALPGSIPPREPEERDPIGGPRGGPTAPPTSTSPGVFVALAVLLAAVVGGLAFVVWQRGPRGDVSPEAAWRGISRLAARLGFGPRPTQTVYEYATALGDVLPTSRPELQTVARAKVEVAYGRRVLGEDGLRRLRDAHRQLRVALLRLVFRRRERRAHRQR